MRFLSVADRELRAAARRSRTHFVRWVTGFAFFGLLIWLFWVLDGFRNRNAAPEVFQILSVITFIYALFVGAAVTADCISSEKREGTLGLLFLTNLNSFEIILGKLCSGALVTMYGLFSVFPMLALLMMCGGIALDRFWQTVFALANAIFFAVASGFVASVLCVRQFTSVALATGLALVIGLGLLGAAAVVNSLHGPQFWVEALALLCPLYCLVAAGGDRIFGQNHYWLSFALVLCLSLGSLLVAALRLARTWRDRPRSVPATLRSSLSEHWRLSGAVGRAKLRHRLLDRNPFFWLAAPQQIGAPIFMLLTVLLVAITVYVTTPFLERLFRTGPGGLEALTCAWMWLGVGLHILVLYYAAMIASQRVAEDKQSGAFELILSTPVTEELISRGFWLAYWRRLAFPALAAGGVHLSFIWLGATFLASEADVVPRGMGAGELLWRALWKLPVTGRSDDWSFWFAFRIFLLLLILAIGVWFTLGWLGRWLGLRMKHPGFAPLVALGLVIVPPVLAFSLFCYVASELRFYRMSERIVIPTFMWTGFGLGALHCLVLSRWASVRLRRDFRETVIGRFNLPRTRFWWLPRPRAMVRYAVWVMVAVGVAGLLVLGFYAYQDQRSRRHWTEFQRSLAKRGETLDLPPLMPTPVSDETNFARAAAFKRFYNSEGETKRLFNGLQRWETAVANYGTFTSVEWTSRQFAPLADYLSLAVAHVPPGLKTNRTEVAPVLLAGWQSQKEILRDIAIAARLPHFQVSTNRDALAVLQPDPALISALKRLHFVFCVRACALLAANQPGEASEDVLTSLHLARLARQLPDAAAATRLQVMLAQSFQPLWEGLAEHQWSEAQLAAFQQELGQFDLLADYTNVVRRVVRAHIQLWRTYPDAPVQPRFVPIAGGSSQEMEYPWIRPRAWWFDDCIQLYGVGEAALTRVDAAGQLIRHPSDWSEIQSLPLGNQTEQFLGQYQWWWPATPTLLAFAQNAWSQAVTACALERYHLATGSYPATLNELTPTYLKSVPNDFVRGRPMLYDRTDDGHYCLRSVGPNETDDRRNKSSDDWLWTYSTNAPAK